VDSATVGELYGVVGDTAPAIRVWGRKRRRHYSRESKIFLYGGGLGFPGSFACRGKLGGVHVLALSLLVLLTPTGT
jgi:hypothetical protein